MLPDRFVGDATVPVAVSVQAVAAACPPLLLVMVLRRWSAGALSLFVIAQVAVLPAVTVTEVQFE